VLGSATVNITILRRKSSFVLHGPSRQASRWLTAIHSVTALRSQLEASGYRAEMVANGPWYCTFGNRYKAEALDV